MSLLASRWVAGGMKPGKAGMRVVKGGRELACHIVAENNHSSASAQPADDVSGAAGLAETEL